MIRRILDLQHARPFVPYEIELSSGNVITVSNPDLVSIQDSGPGYLAIWGREEGSLTTIPGLYIVRVTTTQPQPS
jgi:hypothetical protein